jgi:hypothetical protein
MKAAFLGLNMRLCENFSTKNKKFWPVSYLDSNNDSDPDLNPFRIRNNELIKSLAFRSGRIPLPGMVRSPDLTTS